MNDNGRFAIHGNPASPSGSVKLRVHVVVPVGKEDSVGHVHHARVLLDVGTPDESYGLEAIGAEGAIVQAGDHRPVFQAGNRSRVPSGLKVEVVVARQKEVGLVGFVGGLHRI